MAETKYGYVGKILRVDLTAGTVSTVPTSNYVPKFVGGRGIGAKIHWDEVPPAAKALDPANVITFMTGPMTGTLMDGGKTTVQTVAPATYPVECYLRSSFGGHWGPELKFAGYDGIIVKGKAKSPVYLWIHDGEAEIRDAGNLWGLDTFAVLQDLQKRHGEKTRVVKIGPAGENLCRNSVIASDDSSVAGWGGLGAVMGSKNLKAIAVRGTGGIPVARPQELLNLALYEQGLISRREGEALAPRRGSPAAGVALREEAKKNPAAVRVGFSSCWGCPLACGMSVRVADGSEIGSGMHRCAETYSDTAAVAYYGGETMGRRQLTRMTLQDRLGLECKPLIYHTLRDLMNMGVLTSQKMGIPYEYGSVEFYRDLLHKIAYRQGFGDKLANGMAKFLNEDLGTPEAIRLYQLKSLVSSRHGGMMRWSPTYLIPGLILAATSTSCGVEFPKGSSRSFKPTMDPSKIKRGSKEYADLQSRMSVKAFGKGAEQAGSNAEKWAWNPYDVPIAIWGEDYTAIKDSLTECCSLGYWFNSPYTADNMGDLSLHTRLYSAVTGIDMTLEESETFAHRLYILERAILTRQGHTRKDDWLWDVVFDDPYTIRDHGSIPKGYKFSREEFSKELDQFYTVRGMDVATGLPRRSTLEALGLKDVADDLKGKYGVTVPA